MESIKAFFDNFLAYLMDCIKAFFDNFVAYLKEGIKAFFDNFVILRQLLFVFKITILMGSNESALRMCPSSLILLLIRVPSMVSMFLTVLFL